MNILRRITTYLCLGLSFTPLMIFADGLSNSDRRHIQEITNQTNLFPENQRSLADHTIRYASIMATLREFNKKAQNQTEKALVRAAESNVEDEYRTLLTQVARSEISQASAESAQIILTDENEDTIE